ncbi:MAG: SGNH/GDSL hydrolase family protein [Gemmataceae bacterium]
MASTAIEAPGAARRAEVSVRRAAPASVALVRAATLLCLALIGDSLAFKFFQGGTLRGVDFLLIGLAAGFLLLLALAPAARRRWSVCLVVLCLTTALFELAVTLAAPAGFPWHVWPPHLSREMTPVDLVGVGPKARFTTNSMGIRGPELSEQDRLRILCVGGSTTECIYLDDDKTWAKLLGDRLASSGPVWVGNAGRSGLMACDHRLYLEHAPEAEQADIWIVLLGFNDLHLQLQGAYEWSKAHSWERTFVYRRPGLSGAWRRPFHRNLFLVQGLDNACHLIERRCLGLGNGAFQDAHADWTRQKRKERAAATITDDLPDLAPFVAEYRRQIQQLIELSRSRGKRLVLLTQPTLYAEPMPPELDALTLGGRLKDGRFLSNRGRCQAMALYNEALRAEAAAHGVLCVDLARLLPASTDMFYDDCHFNEGGARAVADQLAARLPAVRE